MLICRSHNAITTKDIRVITTLNTREHATFACGVNDYAGRTQWLNS